MEILMNPPQENYCHYILNKKKFELISEKITKSGLIATCTQRQCTQPSVSNDFDPRLSMKDKSIWFCLECGYQACGDSKRASPGHISKHYIMSVKLHCFFINIDTSAVFCQTCKVYITPEFHQELLNRFITYLQKKKNALKNDGLGAFASIDENKPNTSATYGRGIKDHKPLILIKKEKINPGYDASENENSFVGYIEFKKLKFEFEKLKQDFQQFKNQFDSSEFPKKRKLSDLEAENHALRQQNAEYQKEIEFLSKLNKKYTLGMGKHYGDSGNQSSEENSQDEPKQKSSRKKIIYDLTDE